MPFVFSHVEYCDTHFVYGFCDGNARAVLQENPRRFPDRMASRIRVSRMQVWRTLHEEDLYPYHDQGYNIWNQATMLSVWICANG